MNPTTFLLFVFSSCLLPLSSLSANDPAVEARKDAGKQTYMAVCFACHQPTGMGLPGMFPPVAGSDWVNAQKPDRLIRMVLHGLVGPIKINGAPFATPAPIMPPQGMLPDDQIANVLTYLRSAFGNHASSVKSEEVAAIRAAEGGRTTPWTEAELLKIPVE